MRFSTLPRCALLALAAIAGAAELTLVAPERSYVSPVSVEGTAPAGLPRVTRYGIIPSPVAATANGVTRSRLVTWDSLNLDGPALAIDARVDDRIALRTNGTSFTVRSPAGETRQVRVVPNLVSFFRLSESGAYRFTRADGTNGVTIRVYAPTVQPDPDQPVAVMTDGHSHRFPLPVAPTTDGLFCTSADPDLIVARAGSSVDIRANTTGTHLGAVRIGSATGPILGIVPVVGFTFDIKDALFPQPVDKDGNVPEREGITVLGAMDQPQRLRARVVMKPWVPNAKLTFTKFAHPAFFLKGATTFTVLSDGTPSSLGEAGMVTTVDADGVRVGTFDYTIYNPPKNGSQCVYLETRMLFGGEPTGVAKLFQRLIGR